MAIAIPAPIPHSAAETATRRKRNGTAGITGSLLPIRYGSAPTNIRPVCQRSEEVHNPYRLASSGGLSVHPADRSSTEEKRSRWAGRPSKPVGAATRPRVGSTPALFRQTPLWPLCHSDGKTHHTL